jgi:uncharacterized repeat protein (TIGR03803 family)
MTATGTLTTLHSFCEQPSCTDGNEPSWLVQATDGDFYGITVQGGRHNACSGGCGTLFKITPAGKLSTLHSFGGTASEGSRPYAGPVQGTGGNFYGTTMQGGSGGAGTIFQYAYTSGPGTLTTLHSFDGTDGVRPQAQIIQGTDGIFYSTTNGDVGTVWSLSMGLDPFVSFVLGTAEVGKIVEILGQGFTSATGVSFNGTPATFSIKNDTYLKATVPVGAICGPVTVTTSGGTLNSNTVFRVKPQITSFTPASGSAGTQVTVTGVSLTQTAEVLFCGVPASFTVNSDTQVTVTVPTGAISGEIVIATAGGKVWSAADFTVTP